MDDLLKKLAKWCERKPFILAAFNQDFSRQILESKNGLARFTLALDHDELAGVKPPSFCLVEVHNGGDHRSLYLGVVLSKSPITTFQSRLVFAHFEELSILSLSDFSNKTKNARLKKIIEAPDLADGKFITLTPALSEEAIKVIIELWC